MRSAICTAAPRPPEAAIGEIGSEAAAVWAAAAAAAAAPRAHDASRARPPPAARRRRRRRCGDWALGAPVAAMVLLLPLLLLQSLPRADADDLRLPDLIASFTPSSLSGPIARPATRACAGLLNGGPEFGAKFLRPLRMANYRGLACNNPAAYANMVKAGATNIQCDVQHWLNCTSLPANLSDTSMCPVWPGRGGDWSRYEQVVASLVAKKAGPRTSWGVWNVSATPDLPFCRTVSADDA
jgi:hypothetical protein